MSHDRETSGTGGQNRGATRWHRAHRRDVRGVIAGVFAVIGLLLLVRLATLAPGGARPEPAGLVVLGAILAAWTAVNARVYLLGVATSPSGVRIRGVLHTTVLRWSQIDDVLLLPEDGYFGAARQVIWLISPDGLSWVTPVVERTAGPPGAFAFAGPRVHLRPDEVAALARHLHDQAAARR